MGHIFISYAHENSPQVRELYSSIKAAGFDPWLDEENLLAGQNWEREIRGAIKSADLFLACLSKEAVTKRGMVQKGFKIVRDVLMEFPDNAVFFKKLWAVGSHST